MKKYTCNEYRQEMILVGLKKQLTNPDLGKADKERLQAQIRQIEIEMALD